MKIAILSPWTVRSNSVGGTERFVIDLAESFNNSGHEVDVYMLSGNNYCKNNINYISINLFGENRIVDEYFLKQEFNEFNSYESFKDLALRIDKSIPFEKYDLVHLNSQLFLEAGKNNKRIFTIHTNPFEYKLDWGEKSFSIMLDIMKDNYISTDTHFVAPSMYYANIYHELAGINIDFIPHAIDIERLNSLKSKESIYREMGIDLDKKLILLPSRLEPIQKQPMLFLKSFALQSDGVKNKFKIICTGADKQYEKFKNEIIDFCSINNIDISICRFDQMADGYKACDIVVLPSKSESFGYSALEAISLGIVTIINNIPTYMEIAEGAKNCYSFDNNVESLDYLLRNILGNSFDRVIQEKKWKDRYSMKLFCRKYLDLNDKNG